ncbi:MAG: hypothetical protein FWF91_08160 [Coriobacteriia bacterium]|nr:hypothetical protein [Coriobacteriia bacterium]
MAHEEEGVCVIAEDFASVSSTLDTTTTEGSPAGTTEALDPTLNNEGVEEAKEEVSLAIADISRRHQEKDLSVLDFEERVDHLRTVVIRNPMHRELFYKTLAYCQERHILPEVEDFIQSCPEFLSTAQSPYYLLMFLIKGGGTEVLELGEDGELILPEEKEGLTEDEIDDLVVELAFETNEFGRALVEKMSPKNRLLELLDITPAYFDTFIEVLDFLTEKRSMADVDSLLRGRDVLMAGRTQDERPIQPSVFIDKLEKAGGIYWEKGWIITDAGRELLNTLEERRS